MSVSKHTPKPWKAVRNGARPIELYNVIPVGVPKAEQRVTLVFVPANKANATLIAASPDMLDAIKTVLSRIDHTNIHTSLGEMSDTWDILRTAIAKAEGRE